jgi:hypothetical protein
MNRNAQNGFPFGNDRPTSSGDVIDADDFRRID